MIYDDIASIYDNLWRREKSDSPESSRRYLVSEIMRWILSTNRVGNTIVDMGSGPHPIEKELAFRLRNKRVEDLMPVIIHSLDFANISQNNLLNDDRPLPFALHHHRVDMRSSGLPDGIADLLVSNHAIDFAGAYSEASRVLKDTGKFVFILHHPNIWKKSDLSRVDRKVLEIWEQLDSRGMLFENEGTIREIFARDGLSVQNVRLIDQVVYYEPETYWVVEGGKLTN